MLSCVLALVAGISGAAAIFSWMEPFRPFLVGVITVFAALMLSFPYYSGIFFPDNNAAQAMMVKESNVAEVNLSIKGMTCAGC